MIALKYSACYKLTVEYKWKPDDYKKCAQKNKQSACKVGYRGL